MNAKNNRTNGLIGISVSLNKHAQRLMYDIQIEEPDLENNHGEAMSNLRQAIAYVKRAQIIVGENKH